MKRHDRQLTMLVLTFPKIYVVQVRWTQRAMKAQHEIHERSSIEAAVQAK